MFGRNFLEQFYARCFAMADLFMVNDYLVQCDRWLDVAVDVHLFTYKELFYV